MRTLSAADTRLEPLRASKERAATSTSPGAGRGRDPHALDHEAFVGVLATDRFGVAHLRERFLEALSLDQFLGGLQRPAYFRTQGLLGKRRRRHDERRDGQRRPQPRPVASKTARRGYLTNCSLPIIPSLVTPRRCAEASTIATDLYSTSRFGRM